MKPFTHEQFEALKNWMHREISTPQSIECAHLRHNAYALLVNDNEISNDEKWTAWSGSGAYPAGEYFVDIKTRLGKIYRNKSRFVDWEHNGSDNDVMFYRIIDTTSDVNYAKSDIPQYEGKPLYTYNPEIHMLVPREWSMEQLQLMLDESGLHIFDQVNCVHYALLKVFGGEK